MILIFSKLNRCELSFASTHLRAEITYLEISGVRRQSLHLSAQDDAVDDNHRVAAQNIAKRIRLLQC